jgi:hypothetical protein
MRKNINIQGAVKAALMLGLCMLAVLFTHGTAAATKNFTYTIDNFDNILFNNVSLEDYIYNPNDFGTLTPYQGRVNFTITDASTGSDKEGWTVTIQCNTRLRNADSVELPLGTGGLSLAIRANQVTYYTNTDYNITPRTVSLIPASGAPVAHTLIYPNNAKGIGTYTMDITSGDFSLNLNSSPTIPVPGTYTATVTLTIYDYRLPNPLP